MCLTASVGRGGKNLREDVRTVQLLLTLNATQIAGLTTPDGVCGGDTVAAIEQFQHNVIGCKDPLGMLTPLSSAASLIPAETAGGTTLRTLQSGLSPGLTQSKLEVIFIHAAPLTVARFLPAMLAGLAAGELTTPLRQAHFLAQVGHESSELRYTEELASGEAYEGRKDLGNTEKGDGVRFKGRGLIQITGRANYLAYGTARHRDFCTDEAAKCIATEPALAVDVAVWFWETHHLNLLADKDDVLAVTKRVNGGTNGLAAREALLARIQWLLLPAPGDRATTGLLHDLRASQELLSTAA